MTKTIFEQPSPEAMLDSVTEMIEMRDTVNLDKELIAQTKIFKVLQGTLSKQAKTHQEITEKLEEVVLNLTRYYDGRCSSAVYKERPLKFTPKTKTELDMMVRADDIYKIVNSDLKTSERNLQIIEDAMWQLRQRPKNIASIIEWRKYIETGM